MESTEIIEISTDSICGICGSTGAQLYYGGKCCPSCRVFFIRTVNREKPYVCTRGGNCIIKAGCKINCKACRFQQCIQAKMVVEGVGRRKKEKGLDLPSKELIPAIQGKVKKEKLSIKNDVIQSKPLGFNFVNYLKIETNAIGLAKKLIKIEELCDNIHGPRPDNIKTNINVNLADVLMNSLACCDRTSVGWNIPFETKNMTEYFLFSYCRGATMVVDFVTTAPEFHEICDKDRIRLFQENFTSVGILTVIYNSWTRNVREGLILPHGYHFLPVRDSSDELNFFLMKHVEILQKQIAPIFDEIQLTAEEYALLKMCAFFHYCILLSDKSADIACRARNRYSKALVEYVNEEYKYWPETWRAQRIQNLFEILRLVKVAAVYNNEYLARIVALNIGEMRCNLAFDIHIRQV